MVYIPFTNTSYPILFDSKNKIPDELETTENFPLMTDKSLDNTSGENNNSIMNEKNNSKLN